MNNEQRALATLDLTLKNAFETLNKFSVWATTPDSDITFNLVDAIPTLNRTPAELNSGTGIFLKPFKVPSFASVRSSIFGTAGTQSSRYLYWNVNFSGTTGWTFSSYDPTSPAKLNILVDTYFGSNAVGASIFKTNVSEVLVNSSVQLDANSSISINDQNNGTTFILSSTQLVALLSNINLGTPNASSSISGKTIVLTNGDTSRDALRYTNISAGTNTPEANLIVLGPGNNGIQSTFATTIRSGSLDIDLLAGYNFGFQFSGTKNVSGGDLLRATYSTPNYDIFLAYGFGNVKSLNIGDVSNLSLQSNKSLNIFGNYGSIFADSNGIKINSITNLLLTSATKTSIGSKTSVNIGIDDGNGNVSNELVITKGSVVIPNLYVQKKANYVLSGIKHISGYAISPSVIYLADSLSKTISDDNYAFEYSKNLTNQIVESNAGANYDTTINDLSGAIKSYFVRASDDSIEVLAADATFSTPTSVVTSVYDTYTVTGLESVSIFDYAPHVKTFSTANGMYILVTEVTNTGAYSRNVYYGATPAHFDKIASYTIPDPYVYTVDLDYITTGTVDYIWFTHTHIVSGSRWVSDIDTNYTYTLFYLENNCSVVKQNVYNLNKNQIAEGSNPGANDGGKYGRSGKLAKVVVVADSTYGSYALIFGTFGCQWTTYDYTVTGGIVHTLGIGAGSKENYQTHNSHASYLLKYTSGANYITEYVEAVFNNDNSANALLGDGDIVDFSWNHATSIGSVIFSKATSTYKIGIGPISGGLIGQTSSVVVSPASVNFAQQIGCISTNKVIDKLLIARDGTTGYLCEVSNSVAYVAKPNFCTSTSGMVISSGGFMYYNQFTGVIRYYDNGIGGVSESEFEIIVQKKSLNGNYNINGVVVDYLGANFREYGSFYTSFVLSSVAGGDFKLTNSETATDRLIYVEEYNDDITTIIESSNLSFATTPISKILGNSFDASSSIVVSLSNTFKLDGLVKEVKPNVRMTASSLISGRLNFHVEPISYLVKNRLAAITTLEMGGYTIQNISAGLYLITPENNPYSGYRVPYASSYTNLVGSASSNQLQFSNISNGVTEANDMDASLVPFYVTITDNFSYVHDTQDIAHSSIMFKIPHQLIDPTNAAFDPSCAIVNEFSNVVSIKLPYTFGFRAQNCGVRYSKGKSNLILGLTEVAEIGGGC